jgi:DNA modification methylase
VADDIQAKTVYEKRGYVILHSFQVKEMACKVLDDLGFSQFDVQFGLPEVDDRYHIWRISVMCNANKSRIGELVFYAKTGLFDPARSTAPNLIRAGLQQTIMSLPEQTKRFSRTKIIRSDLSSAVMQGDSETVLADLPTESVNLVFTSPPYYNARPDYAEYASYEEYLDKMRSVIRQCHRLLSEGRFFVINVAPVLIRRKNRNESSRRIAVPFDLHRLFIEEGFDFIDDIIWEKPSGAGWATGRGRRFAADRNPLQYKAVPVTEYVLVYRKHTDKLIDWNIRNHPDPIAVSKSKIADGYEQTNIWKIPPSYSRNHPAVFPLKLAERVVQYYSFKDDVVLDPFCGSGTTLIAASNNGRRYIGIDLDQKYCDIAISRLKTS